MEINFTLKAGSREHTEQIPAVMMTFVHAPFVLATFFHIRIYQLLLIQFLPNLRGRLERSRQVQGKVEAR